MKRLVPFVFFAAVLILSIGLLGAGCRSGVCSRVTEVGRRRRSRDDSDELPGLS